MLIVWKNERGDWGYGSVGSHCPVSTEPRAHGAQGKGWVLGRSGGRDRKMRSWDFIAQRQQPGL